MTDYLGIVIEQCLRDPAAAKELRVVKTRRPRSWVFLLVEVPEHELDHQIRILQANMVSDDTWYAHYFRENELVVVFRDAVFRLSTDPSSWGPAVEHGLASGIPREQLDFTPRTRAEAERFFGISPT